MILQEAFDWYLSHNPNTDSLRSSQLNKVIGEIEDEFISNFDSSKKIICIETGASHNWDDGCVGAFFAKLCDLTNGEFHSVDVNPELVNNSEILYNELKFNNITHHIDDSVNYLHNTEVIPNIVHLDSWDLNLRDPFPSALHGWNEFLAIEDKMPLGSLLIVDDNYFNGTWVNWKNNRNDKEWDRVTINYPIVGKGSHIYSYVESGNSNWLKLSNDHIGTNEKLVYKKIKIC
jgi:hypothetical protein